MFTFYSSSSGNLVNVAKYTKFNKFYAFQLLTNIFSRQLKVPSNPVYIPVNEDAEEILENYYIPGKYQHFLKKNRRKLKKEAREESYFGKEPPLKYTSRKSRIEQYPNVTEEITYIDGEKFITPIVSNNSTQRNLAQRLNRAIIKCNDEVPHAFLTSAFIRVVNISISPNLKIARVWWRPEGQKGISKAVIENSFNQHLTQYRSMLQRSMYVKKPPKIIFCREDLQLKDINKILVQIEEELNGNQQRQQPEDIKLENEKDLTDGLQVLTSLDDNDIKK
ncbi:2883_t:CDS:2 [Diversispora eburnea]|uniref:2883_t:CDS:1 n=1 Tax=Diversispora eburnea TaxID=1213867 RepID=A0A9N8VGI4_9GLOM|nr:2883_t:CDS:2 [Diversispora eburnea]